MAVQVIVVAGLPGGDPLAAALAAGQTPSPQMVADAPGEGSLHPIVATILLAGILLSILAIAKLNDYVQWFRHVPFTESPIVLARKARDIIKQLGYGGDAVADSAYGLDGNPWVFGYLGSRDNSPARWEPLSTGQPAYVISGFGKARAALSIANIRQIETRQVNKADGSTS